AKTVLLRDLIKGEETNVSYDNLVISTGAAPFIPPIKGTEQKMEHVHVLRTLNDMKAIKASVNREGAGRVGIIGAGYIGLELAETSLSLSL
ncbi:hypothetical protein KIPB_015770, partial [Kipferlia bialata]